MYDRNQAGQQEPTFATQLNSTISASTSGRQSMSTSLPAGRRSLPPYPQMGHLDRGLFALNGPLRSRLAAAIGMFQLPNTLQGYLVFTFCLLILSFTMILHITLSAEILRLDKRLIALKSEYETVERKNAGIIYEISRYSALQEVYVKAIAAGYVPADKFKFVVDRPEVQAELDNPQSTSLVPEYIILGADPNALVAPDVVRASAPEESAAESGFWSMFRRQRVRDAWAETGTWLRSRLPAWGAP